MNETPTPEQVKAIEEFKNRKPSALEEIIDQMCNDAHYGDWEEVDEGVLKIKQLVCDTIRECLIDEMWRNKKKLSNYQISLWQALKKEIENM